MTMWMVEGDVGKKRLGGEGGIYIYIYICVYKPGIDPGTLHMKS